MRKKTAKTIRFIDIIRVAMGNIMGSKLRSFLTVLGVSVGIGAVVFLVSLGFGLQKLTIEKITSSSAVTTIDVSESSSAVLKLDSEAFSRFSNIKGVETVSPISSQPGQATYNSITADVVALGVSENYFKLEQPKFVAGSKLAGGSELVVSDAVSKLFALKNPLEMLGKKINLELFLSLAGSEAQTFERRSVKGTVVGVVENPAAIVYLPLKKITDLGVKEYSQAKVKVNNVDAVDGVKRQINDLGFQASSVSDVIAEINSAFRVIQYVLAGFGVIALLVASIGMFNTMTIALLERTKDIGIMKAIGARNRDIHRIFVTESVAIALLGGAIGIALAYLLALAINSGLNLLVVDQSEKIILFVFPWQFLIAILIVTVVVGLFTGIYPARRAAKLNPLNALRYE